MLESVIFLYSYGYYGGQIGNMLAKWEQAGVFSYLLPFLLLFALIFGILTKTNLFKDKSINAIIALAVGLMSLQFDFVPRFFAEIFPRMGVGLAVILAVIIFLGLFTVDNKSWSTYVFFGIGLIVLVVVLINTAGNIGWYQGYWWSQHWFDVTVVAVLLAVIGIIVGASNPQTTAATSPFIKSLLESK